jgi:protein-S-isoprenylcysteine O-methyltransferase Ste14
MRSASRLFPQLIGAAVLIALTVSLRVDRNAAWWTGLVLAVIGGGFLLTARYQLGESFSVSPQARQLVTRGIYSRIRNPLYVFSTLMIVGLVIAYQHPRALLFPAALAVVQVIRARRESQVLERAFGDEYREYRKRTWF